METKAGISLKSVFCLHLFALFCACFIIAIQPVHCEGRGVFRNLVSSAVEKPKEEFFPRAVAAENDPKIINNSRYLPYQKNGTKDGEKIKLEQRRCIAPPLKKLSLVQNRKAEGPKLIPAASPSEETLYKGTKGTSFAGLFEDERVDDPQRYTDTQLALKPDTISMKLQSNAKKDIIKSGPSRVEEVLTTAASSTSPARRNAKKDIIRSGPSRVEEVLTTAASSTSPARRSSGRSIWWYASISIQGALLLLALYLYGDGVQHLMANGIGELRQNLLWPLYYLSAPSDSLNMDAEQLLIMRTMASFTTLVLGGAFFKSAEYLIGGFFRGVGHLVDKIRGKKEEKVLAIDTSDQKASDYKMEKVEGEGVVAGKKASIQASTAPVPFRRRSIMSTLWKILSSKYFKLAIVLIGVAVYAVGVRHLKQFTEDENYAGLRVYVWPFRNGRVLVEEIRRGSVSRVTQLASLTVMPLIALVTGSIETFKCLFRKLTKKVNKQEEVDK